MCFRSGSFSILGGQGVNTKNLVKARKKLGGEGQGEEEGREGHMG